MFGGKLEVQMEILDTDYENFLIGYECYDNMQMSLENEMEPVHIITIGIATRDPNTPDSVLAKYEEIVANLIPDVEVDDMAKIL